MTESLELNIPSHIIPMYDGVLEDILDHNHTHYIFAGGRGSTKSSFVSLAIIILILTNPKIHALIFRKVGNTIKNSIWGQMVWAIYELGLESLFKMPKTYSSPLIFLPTGQQIMFFGLDDADKVKSIKVPFGYIGVTWFEELDQYSGDAEIRKVLQSTMRGGDIFWDFRSFNPPISINNWANEYAEQAETRDDSIVIRNTYLDVPRDWLGEPFIHEAEVMIELNPRGYTHEYLGIPIGTGGNVFQNVEDMNMEELVDINGQGVPMFQTFDNIFNGIDWGFSIDPFRFVRMHFDKKRRELYIFSEYSTVETRNEEIFDEIYNVRKIANINDLVTADSAEKKSCADFRAYGAFVRDAEKGPDSVRYGIKWLQGLTHIYIDKRRCPLTYQEFVHYEYDTDKDGNWVSSYPDKNNHSIDATRYAMERFYKRKGN